MQAPLLQTPSVDTTSMLDVVVPNGAGPGSMFMVADPNTGQQFQVSVPEGATPGATFKVAVPKPVATTVIQQVVQPVIQQVALPNSAIPGYRTTYSRMVTRR